LAYLVHPPHDGLPTQVYLLVAMQLDNAAEARLLLELVDIYKGKPDTAIHRVDSDDIEAYLHDYDAVGGLIVFPPYRPADLLALTRAGLRVPTGITRHIIPARALRVNVPLPLL